MKLRGRIVRGFCDLLHILVARDSTSSNTETERAPMFGTQTMARGQGLRVALWRDLFFKVIVAGAFILFAGLATIDDLLVIFR
jgi:hypothetical protein